MSKKKLAYTDGTDIVVQFAVIGTHKVVDTKGDTKAPWLTLRDQAGSKKGKRLGKLVDGTQIVAKYRDKVKPWWFVEVITGKEKGKVGWVFAGVGKKGQLGYKGGKVPKFIEALDKNTKPPDPVDNFKVPAGKAQWEVFDTYKDTNNEPWLTLRTEKGSEKGKIVAENIDGVLVQKLKGKKTHKSWWKIKVISGQFAGKTGWSNAKWLRKPQIKPEKDLPPNSAPTEYKVTASEGFSLIGENLTAKSLTELSGMDGLNFKDDTQILNLTNTLWGNSNPTINPVSNTFAYFDKNRQSLTFVLPWLSVNRADSVKYRDYLAGGLGDAPTFIVESALRAALWKKLVPKPADDATTQWFALDFDSSVAEHLQAEWDSFEVYKTTAFASRFGWVFLSTSPAIRKLLADTAEEYLGIKSSVFSEYLERVWLTLLGKKGIPFKGAGDAVIQMPKPNDFLTWELKPNTSSGPPRWLSYYLRFDLTKFVQWASQISYYGPLQKDSPENYVLADPKTDTQRVLFTSEGIRALTNSTDGIIYGADIVHGLMGKAFFENHIKYSYLTTDMPQLTTQFEYFEKQIEMWDRKLAKATIGILAGPSEATAKVIPTSQDQGQFLRVFPTMLKAATIKDAAVTSEAMEAADNLTLTVVFEDDVYHDGLRRDMKMVGLYVEPSAMSQGSGLDYKVPALSSQDVATGKQETVVLSRGRLALADKDLFSKVTVKESIQKEFEALAKLLEKKPEDKSIPEFLMNSPVGHPVQLYTLWVMATVVTKAFKEGVFPFSADLGSGGLAKAGESPEMPINTKILTTRKVVDGKIVDITDFSNILKYSLGENAAKIGVEYLPNYAKALREFAYITVTEDEKTIFFNWAALTTKMFKQKTNEAFKDYNIFHFSYLFAVHDVPKLVLAQTYRDFFDKVYLSKVFYKKGAYPFTEAEKKKMSEKAAHRNSPVTLALTDPLTAKEKLEILNRLKHHKYQITEEVFAGTGCVEEALKIVKTIDDLYDATTNKLSWPIFICQAIDRFKCDLVKLSGQASAENLKCLADFDVCGTYDKGLKAKDVIENFSEVLDYEMQKMPTAPVYNFILGREVPVMPSLDWYQCIRSIIKALIYKLIVDLIKLVINAILSLLGLCPLDFDGCEMSDLDQNSSLRGAIGACGFSDHELGKAAQRIAPAIPRWSVNASTLKQFCESLAGQFTAPQLKKLYEGTPSTWYLNQAALVINNLIKTSGIELTNDEVLIVLQAMGSVSGAALAAIIGLDIASAIGLSAVLTDENCPPELVAVNRSSGEAQSVWKDAFVGRLKEEQGLSDEEANATVASAQEEIEERVSKLCEILEGVTALINTITNSATIIAGFTDFALSMGIQFIVQQLRIKAYYDFYQLRYLFTGDMFGGNPTQKEILTADMSLAFNIVYANYFLYKNPDAIDKNGNLKPYTKNYNFKVPLLSNKYAVDPVASDSFEKEFLQDVVFIICLATVFPMMFWADIEGELAGKGEPLTPMDKAMFAASQKANNPNYFYGWLEELAAKLIPGIDPRRFGAKYKFFVEAEYPNAVGEISNVKQIAAAKKIKKPWETLPDPTYAVTQLNPDYQFIIEESSEGLQFRYGIKIPDSDGSEVFESLMDFKMGIDNRMEVEIMDGEKTYTRPLPALPEPFYVKTAGTVEKLLSEYNSFNSMDDANKLELPQRKIFFSLVERSLTQYDILPTGGSPNTLSFLETSVNPIFDAYFNAMKKEINDAYRDNKESVTYFFLAPFIQAAKIAKKCPKGSIPCPEEVCKDFDDAEEADNGNWCIEMPEDTDDFNEEHQTAFRLLGESVKGFFPPPVSKFFKAADGVNNIMTQVMFPGSIGDDIEKVMDKFSGGMKKMVRAATEGKVYDPAVLQSKISVSSDRVYYEAEREINQLIPNGVWLTDISLGEASQKKILKAIKKVTQ